MKPVSKPLRAVTGAEAEPSEPSPPPASAVVPVVDTTPAPAAVAEVEAPAAKPEASAAEASAPAATATPVPIDLPPPRAAMTSKPLLASEALMEDLAPVEPARRDARTWCAVVGAGFVLLGTLPLVGLGPGGMRAAVPLLVTGAISLVASVARVAYRERALAMIVLGLLSGLVALLANGGALFRAADGAAWGLSRMVAGVAIAAALFFRARYRAYAGARIFLGTALALSLPFVVHLALRFTGPASSGVATVGAIVCLAMIATSLTGFMGAETTGAGAYLAPATVAVFAAELAFQAIWSPEPDGSLFGITTAAIAFGGASALTAVGLFQILAWRFAADARRIDLHSPPRPPQESRDPGSDWSMRD